MFWGRGLLRQKTSPFRIPRLLFFSPSQIVFATLHRCCGRRGKLVSSVGHRHRHRLSGNCCGDPKHIQKQKKCGNRIFHNKQRLDHKAKRDMPPQSSGCLRGSFDGMSGVGKK
ncbi:unnamed protein product [Camellia sinensis]